MLNALMELKVDKTSKRQQQTQDNTQKQATNRRPKSSQFAYGSATASGLHPVPSSAAILLLLDGLEHEGGVGGLGHGGQAAVLVEVVEAGSAQQDVIPPAVVPVLGR